MALTVNILKRNKYMNDYSIIANVTFDASYPTGGLSLLPADFGLQTLEIVNAGASVSGNTFGYDYAAQKLKAFSGAAEVANATNLAAVTVRLSGVGY